MPPARGKIVLLSKKFSQSFIVILICFILDRLSKIYVIDLFTQTNVNDNIYINPYLNIILLWNTGIAFGLLKSDSFVYSLITLLIFLIIIFLFYLITKVKKSFEILCLSLIIGGATGNFIDRIYYKAVPDFIDVHYNDFHWFIFNIADIFISIGIIMLLTFDIINNNIKKND